MLQLSRTKNAGRTRKTETIMTDKELREIKRRFRPERCNIQKIVGCFVGENKQILYRISQTVGMDSVVTDKLLSTMKRAISGTLGVNLTEVPYSTKQVTESPEHKLLMTLRQSALGDKDALEAFYAKAIETLEFDSPYAILLANDVYDVPSFSKDGEEDGSSEVFSYIVCAICPLKSLPEAIRFNESDSLFHAINTSSVLSTPELGFMFPAFDDRRTNIYSALFYSKNLGKSYPAFKEKLLASEPHMPPKAQESTFCDILSDTLKEECSLEVVRSLQAQAKEMIDAHKESKSKEPLTLTKEGVKHMLEGCGIDEEKLSALSESFDESFGQNAVLSPKCLIKTDKMKVEMPEVKINVSPEYRDKISTQVIGENKYVMIKVTGPLTVNGINIKIDE